MAIHTEKSEAIENLITSVTGGDRREVIQRNTCMPPPFGCGGPARVFNDSLSAKEYTISGLCQKCQDKVFTPNYDGLEDYDV